MSKFKQILGPSPLLYGIKNVYTRLFFRGKSKNGACLSDDTLFEMITEPTDSNFVKPRRLNNKELRELLSNKNKLKLTKEQHLLKSVIEQAKLSRAISDINFQNVQDMYEFRRKYKNYFRIKRFFPLAVVAPFTSSELSKMAYATALGSKCVVLTLPGLIGYSLPTFFFFHMSSYYVPDKTKPVCQLCNYTLGAPFWIASSITDGLTAIPEEKWFGKEVPIDVVNTGGTIPKDLGNINKLREML